MIGTRLKKSKPGLQEKTPEALEQIPKQPPKKFSKVIFPDVSFSKRRSQSQFKIRLYRLRKLDFRELPLFGKNPQTLKSFKYSSSVMINDSNVKMTSKKLKLYYKVLTLLNKIKGYFFHLQLFWHPDLGSFRSERFWKKLISFRKGALVRKLEIYPSFTVPVLGPYQRAQTTSDLLWWEIFLPLIISLKDLRSISILLDTHLYKYQKTIDQIPLKFSNKLKRLQKLKEISLIRLEEGITEHRSVYKNLLNSTGCEKVNLTICENMKQEILESLMKMKDLEVINVQGNIEINELVSLVEGHNKLKSLGFVISWPHVIDKNDLKMIKSCNGFKNIQSLILDCGLRVNSETDQTFYLEFLKGFSNVEHLKLDISWAKKLEFISAYTKTLCYFQKLKKLEVAISFITLESMSDFFRKLKSLKLSHFTLVSDIKFPRDMRKKLPAVLDTFGEFIKSQKELESLEMYFYRIGVPFLEELCRMIKTLQKIKTIKLAFGTNSDRYLKIHEEMYKMLLRTVRTLTNVEHLTIKIVIKQGYFYLPDEDEDEQATKPTVKNLSLKVERYFNFMPFSFTWE